MHTCVTVPIDVIIPLPYSYPNWLIPSVLPLFNLYIPHCSVLISTLVLQTINFTMKYICDQIETH